MRLLCLAILIVPSLALGSSPSYVTAGLAWAPKVGDMHESVTGIKLTGGYQATTNTAVEVSGYAYNTLSEDSRDSFFFVSGEAFVDVSLDNVFSASLIHGIDAGPGEITGRLGWYTVDIDYAEHTFIDSGLPFVPPIEHHREEKWSNDGPLVGIGYRVGGFRIEGQAWIDGADAPPLDNSGHFGVILLERVFRW